MAEIIPIIRCFGRAKFRLGDADEEAHEGNAFVRRTVEVGDAGSLAEEGVQADEAVFSVQIADRNPRGIDKVEGVHGMLDRLWVAGLKPRFFVFILIGYGHIRVSFMAESGDGVVGEGKGGGCWSVGGQALAELIKHGEDGAG